MMGEKTRHFTPVPTSRVHNDTLLVFRIDWLTEAP